MVESLLLRPLPYAHSDRLIYIGPKTDKLQFSNTSWLNYRDIREQSHCVQAVGAYVEDVAVVQTKDASNRVVAVRLTPSIFSMLGVQPLLGRMFTEAEGQAGGPYAVMLSEGLWRDTFKADPEIVGKSVRIGGVVHTVVGVMPYRMSFPEDAGPDLQKGVWLPMQPTPEMLKDRGYNFTAIVGELRPGVTAEQAQAEMDIIAQRIIHDDPNDIHSRFGLRVTPYLRLLTVQVRPVLLALLERSRWCC